MIYEEITIKVACETYGVAGVTGLDYVIDTLTEHLPIECILLPDYDSVPMKLVKDEEQIKRLPDVA